MHLPAGDVLVHCGDLSYEESRSKEGRSLLDKCRSRRSRRFGRLVVCVCEYFCMFLMLLFVCIMLVSLSSCLRVISFLRIFLGLSGSDWLVVHWNAGIRNPSISTNLYSFLKSQACPFVPLHFCLELLGIPRRRCLIRKG